ncbi:MAG: DUF1501 domain-containing protein [Deltaproteobacteria bacterium]|nr:DUF1501 domain-containing protein [Deltaproteobacteria bacterium]
MGPKRASSIFGRRQLMASAAALTSAFGPHASQRAWGVEAATVGVPHHKPKAKRVIVLFMAGAPSQLDLFDYKPALKRFDGTLPPKELLQGYRAAFINPKSALLASRFNFARHGKSGTFVSELLPHTAAIVDEIAIIRSMKTEAFNHAPAQTMITTGSQQVGRPSLGAWTLFALGSESKDLPGFVVLQSGDKGPSGGTAISGSGFLPTLHQGVPFRGGAEPILFLGSPQGIDQRTQRQTLDAIATLNQSHLQQVGDPEIITRMNAYDLAYRMQDAAPEAIDLKRESQATLELYGAKPGETSFANNCLLARRLVERGVRFVQLVHEAWDHHAGLKAGLEKQCRLTDKACSALVLDLKRRGLLEDTLVIWGGEFGRTPMVQGGTDGRDHHPNAFTMWMAGGGVKPGVSLGDTDELGFNVTRDPVDVHDLHATILDLLGLDHKRLTFRFSGRDYRLTDVAGKVVQQLVAWA